LEAHRKYTSKGEDDDKTDLTEKFGKTSSGVQFPLTGPDFCGDDNKWSCHITVNLLAS
jgi:hypothetical protein